MGYWVVIAMVIVAVIAVLFAVMTESEHRLARYPASNGMPLVVLIGTRATADAQTALSPPWTERVRSALNRSVEVYDATVPSARIHDYSGSDIIAIFRRPPALAVIWLGIDDFLLGTDLGTFERGLGHLLGSLAAEHISLVTIALPDLEPLIAQGEATKEEIIAARAEIRRWNATIARLATAYRARLLTGAEILPGVERLSLIGAHEQGRWFIPEVGHEAVAAAVASAIRDELVTRQSDATPEPAA